MDGEDTVLVKMIISTLQNSSQMPQIQNHFFASSLMIIQKMVKMMMIIEMTCHKTGVVQPRIPSQEDIKTGEKLTRFCNFATLQCSDLYVDCCIITCGL